METIQQKMAVNALAQIKAFKGTSAPAEHEKYRTMALKLPILILSDGLVQALAFVQARGEDAQKRLIDNVAQTVEWQGTDNGEALVRLSREAGLGEYMLLTRRVLAALVWYKRYAETVLAKPLKKGSDSEGPAPDAETAVPAQGGRNA